MNTYVPGVLAQITLISGARFFLSDLLPFCSSMNFLSLCDVNNLGISLLDCCCNNNDLSDPTNKTFQFLIKSIILSKHLQCSTVYKVKLLVFTFSVYL